jgi:hypothetical protein
LPAGEVGVSPPARHIPGSQQRPTTCGLAGFAHRLVHGLDRVSGHKRRNRRVLAAKPTAVLISVAFVLERMRGLERWSRPNSDLAKRNDLASDRELADEKRMVWGLGCQNGDLHGEATSAS